jgi:undecaprenyl-diphosphatase
VTFIQAILLGIVQGLTEFFPISSSAHLKLARSLLGAPDDLFFDLVCHSGTLLALLIFLKKEVFEVLKSVKKMALFFLALIPLIPGYFFLKPVRLFLSEPNFLGYALMMTGALLFFASKKREIIPNKKWQHVLCIGVMQTMALIPGISRSGSTIAAARFCGWDWLDAAKFSFLLAIPTILGGEALELLRGPSVLPAKAICYGGGFLASFLLGLISVRFIFWIYETGKVRPFAWYSLAMGLLAWTLYHG